MKPALDSRHRTPYLLLTPAGLFSIAPVIVPSELWATWWHVRTQLLVARL
jgi:hypothetical protein